MADERTSAPDAPAGGSGTTSGDPGSVTPPAPNATATNDAPQQQETPEQREQRLERALAEERRLRLKREQEARDEREARKALEDERARFTPTPPADPRAQILDQIRAADAVLNQYPNDVATAAARQFYQMQLGALDRHEESQRLGRWVSDQEEAINASSEPDAIKARAREIVRGGADAQAAIYQAHGEAAKKSQTQRDEADRIAAANLATKPNTAAGGAGNSNSGRTRMTNAQYLQRINEPGGWKLVRQRASGEIVVEG